MPYRSGDVNANLTKGAAGASDVLQLLRLWQDGESPADFQQRAIEENLLGKASRTRARDFVKSVLGRRYFPEGSEFPARHIQHLAATDLPREAVLQVLYYHAALAEHLLYLVSADFVYGLRTQGISEVSSAQTARFIRGLATSGHPTSGYSDAVVEKLAQTALTTLRDFGILEGKARKRIAPVRMPHTVVGYLVYALREEGDTARRIIDHPDWRLFLLTPREVEEAILEGARYGHYTYSAAGDIRRFDWHFDSLTDYVESVAATPA